MKGRVLGLVVGFLALMGGALAASQGCAASDGDTESTSGNGTPAGTGGSIGGSSPSTGGTTISVNVGGQGGNGGVIMDPCNSRCGPTELCDPQAVALDDDCDGQVDEGCPCSSGNAQACFKGEPAYVDEPGCFPGSQKCDEFGAWGACEGGLHATDMCYMADQSGCHAIESVPFLQVDLKTGTGTFSNGALSESWTVQCPSGVNPCPAVQGTNPADDFTPLASGEYTVTYTKTTGMGPETCTYPLFIGAPGLRVELTWDWIPNQGSDTVDLDLHLHKPNDFNPWGGTAGNAYDCAYNNCVAWAHPGLPAWFTGVAPPDPVEWYLDPVFEKNTCYFGPKGNGAEWQAIGLGCHNPRLDIDNISCDPTITDPQDFSFCNPENTNIDYPPKDQWTRIGVHYYSEHGQTYNVHPVVRIFCHGRLAAELGNQGFYTPEAGIQFLPSGGGETFWLVADVLFRDDECDEQLCYVQPLYLDPNAKTPVLTTSDIVTMTYGPPYPPVPP